MKKSLIIAGMLLTAVSASAQDTYENARALGYDLNGTARYVGMGGAMEALGADISTISTNPAGIGMFRHSTVSLSFGGVKQDDVKKFDNLNTTNMSFDQIGFVYSQPTGRSSFINFGFNYHKSRNFDQIIQVNNILGGRGSLNKLAYAKGTFRSDVNGGYDLGYNTRKNKWMGYRNPNEDSEFAYPFTQWDYLYTNVYNVDDVNDFKGEPVFSEASDFYFDKAHRGWIANYDFNLSGNVNNRFYWGLTVGIYDMDYRSYSIYDEMLLNGMGNEIGNLELHDDHKIEGHGADIKAGVIFLPIEESPFRIGLNIATPTWYDMKSINTTTLVNNTETPAGYQPWGYDYLTSEDTYEYRYFTPWKFGISLGHTIGNYLALGASYEYSDYSTADTRIYDGSFDYYDDENTESDRVMNDHTGHTLKGVSLFKVGAELKPDPSLAVRVGYNYQSAAYNDNGIRDTRLDSPGTYFSSTPDYVNWDGTNRITCGLGYKYEGFGIDLAYQYSTTKGTFYPYQPDVHFMDYDNPEVNYSAPTSLDFKRHQLLLTLSYTF